jgi:hypothetical protein
MLVLDATVIPVFQDDAVSKETAYATFAETAV